MPASPQSRYFVVAYDQKRTRHQFGPGADNKKYEFHKGTRVISDLSVTIRDQVGDSVTMTVYNYFPLLSNLFDILVKLGKVTGLVPVKQQPQLRRVQSFPIYLNAETWHDNRRWHFMIVRE